MTVLFTEIDIYVNRSYRTPVNSLLHQKRRAVWAKEYNNILMMNFRQIQGLSNSWKLNMRLASKKWLITSDSAIFIHVVSAGNSTFRIRWKTVSVNLHWLDNLFPADLGKWMDANRTSRTQCQCCRGSFVAKRLWPSTIDMYIVCVTAYTRK